MKRNIYLIILLLSLAGFKGSTVRTITGTVRDQIDGSPLPGVTVRVEGTNIGISTGTDGHYSIKIPSNEVKLVFSFIGYETLKAQPGKSERLDVLLKRSSSQLDEVVVVGYATQKRKDQLYLI